MKTILVLGGAGYIGSHTVYELIDNGYDVVVADNLETGFRKAVHPKARFYQGDIRNKEFCDHVFSSEKIDAVIHFAANSQVGESMVNPLKYYDNNLGGTRTMLQSMIEHGVKYMDAPVSGGTIGAQKGTLTIMCGADEETFEKAKPVLEAIGKRIMRIGGTGMGDAMKIVNNMLLGANMASLAEALVLGAKLGLDNKTMYDVISTSSGNSYVVDAKMKKFIMPDKFEPGFAMDVQYKDLTLAQEAARGVKMPIPMSATCTAVYEQARAAGYGMEDMSAVIKLWEKLMGVEIRGELE